MITILIHLGLAVSLFVLQNWIGSRSYSKGYIRFSLLDDTDEALSLNYVVKVFGPIVYLILAVAAFQYFKIASYTADIINVIYYYLGLRVIVIILYERILIVNWPRILFHYISILAISTLIYKKFINSVDSLLPDFNELKNEIWLLIIVFLYQIGNGIEEKLPNNQLQETTTAYLPEIKKRKQKYIIRQHKKFEKEYGKLIDEIGESNKSFKLVILSILIFENFNRPAFIRFLERLWVRVTGRYLTQGIMQTSLDVVLTNKQSVIMGTTNLYNDFKTFGGDDSYNHVRFRRTIKKQCPDKKYVRQVLFIAKNILDAETSKEDYKSLSDEIQQEFQLYDYY